MFADRWNTLKMKFGHFAFPRCATFPFSEIVNITIKQHAAKPNHFQFVSKLNYIVTGEK